MLDAPDCQDPTAAEAGPMRAVLVTGPSGAGRSTAIRALEDAGFEAIDNMPLSLVPRLLAGPRGDRPLALGLDARNRDFSAGALIQTVDELAADPALAVELLYLDCDEGTLLARYSETRRRHPLAPAEDVATGIARERDLLLAVRRRAGALVDTSRMTPHELRAEIGRLFAAPGGAQGMSVGLTSFSYRRGVPRQADAVHDVRFLANPYWDPALRPLDGRDPRVAGHVAADPRHGAFEAACLALLDVVLPAHAAEGRAYYTLAFGCTGGQHRSVAVAESVGAALAKRGYRVSTRHRELERRGLAPASPAGAPHPARDASGRDGAAR